MNMNNIQSAITLKNKIKFFTNDKILTIFDDGRYYIKPIKYNYFSTLNIILIVCILEFILVNIHISINPILDYITSGVILCWILFSLVDKKVRQRHAIEHILVSAIDENRLDNLKITDRLNVDCGMRLVIYIILINSILYFYIGIYVFSLSMIISVLISKILKKWKTNPIIILSLLLQRITTTVPKQDMLEIYQNIMIKVYEQKLI